MVAEIRVEGRLEHNVGLVGNASSFCPLHQHPALGGRKPQAALVQASSFVIQVTCVVEQWPPNSCHLETGPLQLALRYGHPGTVFQLAGDASVGVADVSGKVRRDLSLVT